MPDTILNQLYQTLLQKKGEDPTKSYTAQLFLKGDNQILKKIGEEATELVMAGVKGQAQEIIYETADLFYHILVLLAHKNIPFLEIEKALKGRMGISGLEEKKSRTNQ